MVEIEAIGTSKESLGILVVRYRGWKLQIFGPRYVWRVGRDQIERRVDPEIFIREERVEEGSLDGLERISGAASGRRGKSAESSIFSGELDSI